MKNNHTRPVHGGSDLSMNHAGGFTLSHHLSVYLLLCGFYFQQGTLVLYYLEFIKLWLTCYI